MDDQHTDGTGSAGPDQDASGKDGPDASGLDGAVAANPSEGRPWRLLLAVEGERDPSGRVSRPVGSTGFGPLPRPFRALDGRQIGTVERMWRVPTGDHANVWAEGLLAPGEDMPAQLLPKVTWLNPRDAIREKLLNQANEVCHLVGSSWRWNIAESMEVDYAEVGLGPVMQHRDSDPIDESNFRVILRDLESIDDRVQEVSFGHWGVGWIEEIAVPLDNPAVLDRVDHWVTSLEGYPIADEFDLAELEAEYEAANRPLDTDDDLEPDEPDGPASDAPTPGDPAARLRTRLSTLDTSPPPDLGL